MGKHRALAVDAPVAAAMAEGLSELEVYKALNVALMRSNLTAEAQRDALLSAAVEVLGEIDTRELPQGHFHRDTGGQMLLRQAVELAKGGQA